MKKEWFKVYRILIMMFMVVLIPMKANASTISRYNYAYDIPYDSMYPYSMHLTKGSDSYLLICTSPLYVELNENPSNDNYNNYAINTKHPTAVAPKYRFYKNDSVIYNFGGFRNPENVAVQFGSYLYQLHIKLPASTKQDVSTFNYVSANHDVYMIKFQSGVVSDTIVYGKTYDTGSYVPEYKPSVIPTPKGLRVKLILPTGLFPKIKETQVKTTWTKQTDEDMHMEISIVYSYKSGSTTIKKRLSYITYQDAIKSTVGEHMALMNTDLESHIHSKDSSTTGLTFANGKLSILGYYLRFAKADNEQSKMLFGNWVTVDWATGGALDTGNIENTYDEIYDDVDGNEVKVPDGEYGGIIVDNNGNTIDPSSLRSFTDYLLAIPNILDATFSALMSLVSGLGTFGLVVKAFFVGIPAELMGMVIGGFGLIVVVVIIKILK